MGKFIYALMSVFVIELALTLFVMPTGSPAMSAGFTESNHTILYNFFTAPSTNTNF